MLDNTEISENNPTTDIKPDFLDDASLLNQLPAGICIFDMSGKIVKHNVEAARLLGEKPETRGRYEVYNGHYILHWAEPTIMQHSESPLEDCIRDGKEKKNIENIITRSDLTKVYVQANIIPLYKKRKSRQVSYVI